jgi:hypothetical protein
MLRSGRSVLAFDLHAADRVLGVADASAEALPVPREPVQRRNSRPRGHLLNTLWGYGYQPSLGLFSPDGEARLSSQDPVSSLHRDGPGDCTVSRHFAVPTGLPGDGFVWVAGETGAVKPIRRFLRDEVRLDPRARCRRRVPATRGSRLQPDRRGTVDAPGRHLPRRTAPCYLLA